jgi:hypothetical protein
MLFGGHVYYLWNHLTTNRLGMHSLSNFLCYPESFASGLFCTDRPFQTGVRQDGKKDIIDIGRVARSRMRFRQPLFCSSESRNDERCEEQQSLVLGVTDH